MIFFGDRGKIARNTYKPINMKIILVKYLCKENCRESFLQAIKQNNIDTLCRQEAGNLKYEYAYSEEDDNVLILNEIWRDDEAVRLHGQAVHFKLLGELKSQYVVETKIERFNAEKSE